MFSFSLSFLSIFMFTLVLKKKKKLCVGTSASAFLAVCNERAKRHQKEMLLERLRSKANQYRPLPDTAKAVRMTILDKRFTLDAVEKSNLQKCLDIMQGSIKVTTRQNLVERLESLSRQLGLKFMDDNDNLFISSDMFYLEIILYGDGSVQDVKVHHECKIEQQSCQELISCLQKGDFVDFTNQLEGLSSIYQLNADKNTKSNAYVALQALESDLSSIYVMHEYGADSQTLLSTSPVGILEQRRGGHPMCLTFFIPPYDLLDTRRKKLLTASPEVVRGKSSVGLSVTVHLEASSANKLQLQPLINSRIKSGAEPNYEPLTSANSIMLPGCFVLRLNHFMPVSMNVIRQIQRITDIKLDEGMNLKETPLLELIIQQATDGAVIDPTLGIFLSMPDQNHCYFLIENQEAMVRLLYHDSSRRFLMAASASSGNQY